MGLGTDRALHPTPPPSTALRVGSTAPPLSPQTQLQQLGDSLERGFKGLLAPAAAPSPRSTHLQCP